MTPREDAERWLKEARGNQASAQTLFGLSAYSQCAFHCQQSAEMALKAVLYNAEMRPFGHSLTDLLDTIEEKGVAQLDLDVQAAAAGLNKHYIDSRYPDAVKGLAPSDFYTQAMAQQAQEWTDQILHFVSTILK